MRASAANAALLDAAAMSLAFAKSTIFPGCTLMRCQAVTDVRGALVALETGRHVPFLIARVSFMYGVDPTEPMGFRAHHALHQWVVCIAGSCTMRFNDGQAWREAALNSPDLGVYIGPMIWHEMYDFAPGTVLMGLASALYDEADCIRDFEAFVMLAKK